MVLSGVESAPTHTYAEWLNSKVELYDLQIDPLQMHNWLALAAMPKKDAAAATRASGQTTRRTGQLHGLEALARQSATRGRQRVWRVEPSRQ